MKEMSERRREKRGRRKGEMAFEERCCFVRAAKRLFLLSALEAVLKSLTLTHGTRGGGSTIGLSLWMSDARRGPQLSRLEGWKC